MTPKACDDPKITWLWTETVISMTLYVRLCPRQMVSRKNYAS
jgi:hypothetical protein